MVQTEWFVRSVAHTSKRHGRPTLTDARTSERTGEGGAANALREAKATRKLFKNNSKQHMNCFLECMYSFFLLAHPTHAQSLTHALAKTKKALVTARLARNRAMGGAPPGPRSPCPAARVAGVRTRHVQVTNGAGEDLAFVRYDGIAERRTQLLMETCA